MSNTIMKDVQRDIKERTEGLSGVEYTSFLRELAEWAEMQAEKVDYSDDFYQHFDND